MALETCRVLASKFLQARTLSSEETKLRINAKTVVEVPDKEELGLRTQVS